VILLTNRDYVKIGMPTGTPSSIYLASQSESGTTIMPLGSTTPLSPFDSVCVYGSGSVQQANPINGTLYITIVHFIDPNTNFRTVVYQKSDNDLLCFVSSTNVIMHDFTYRMIKNIKIGDLVLEDKLTNKSSKVTNLLKFVGTHKLFKLKKDLLGNNEETICTDHPIWVNNDNNRIFPSNMQGVEHILINEPLYDIVYDTEGTFYANDMKVDSLSPWNPHYGTTTYEYMIYDEDDPIRNKPPMINTL